MCKKLLGKYVLYLLLLYVAANLQIHQLYSQSSMPLTQQSNSLNSTMQNSQENSQSLIDLMENSESSTVTQIANSVTPPVLWNLATTTLSQLQAKLVTLEKQVKTLQTTSSNLSSSLESTTQLLSDTTMLLESSKMELDKMKISLETANSIVNNNSQYFTLYNELTASIKKDTKAFENKISKLERGKSIALIFMWSAIVIGLVGWLMFALKMIFKF